MDENLERILESSKTKYWRDIPLSYFTSLQIGGCADYLVMIETTKQLENVIKELHLRQIPLFILGSGQNVLISDVGFRGVVIKNDVREMQLRSLDDERMLLEVSSGSLFSTVCVTTALEYDLIGLDWGIYIPGTVGGAVVNNADSFGYDVAQNLHRVQILTTDGKVSWVNSANLSFGKRQSQFAKNGGDIILSAEFILNKASSELISKRSENFKRGWRPEQPNAGAIFRSPEGQSVAKLIEEVGLKGYKIGDAAISLQHPAWFVNLGKATADDFVRLMMLTVTRIFEARAIRLQPTLKYIGELPPEAVDLFS